ncbi:MAG TPA: Na+/H+ antiporter subunit E [Geodermatophilus sp.]|nr:Na+/H+ antiporter subunit E [Geodermatophilus sp.]
MSGGGGAHGALANVRHNVPLLVWLVLVWILLWGTWSWANLISGIAVALAVTLVLPLPSIVGGLRFRPLPALAYLGRFAVDLVVSSAQVAWLAFRPGSPPRAAIVWVQLRTDSDLLLTMTAETLSLIPGSIVLDLDRERRRIALHLLHMRDEEDVREEKARVLATEERIVRAFGGPDDLAALERPVPSAGPAPSGRPARRTP